MMKCRGDTKRSFIGRNLGLNLKKIANLVAVVAMMYQIGSESGGLAVMQNS